MFTWDENKNKTNIEKHGVSFEDAVKVFDDPNRFTRADAKHSQDELREVCIGMIKGGIVTVRYTVRGKDIRIIGAGFWREGKRKYEQRNNIH